MTGLPPAAATPRWYRVREVSADAPHGSPAADHAAMLPAALDAARRAQLLAAGWLCRGQGAGLELITTAGPLPASPDPDPAGGDAELLFPWGARGTLPGADLAAALDRLVWAPCPGRRVRPGEDAAARPPDSGGHQHQQQQQPPTLFETALQALAGRPFGWLVTAQPAGPLEEEVAALRAELTLQRRYTDEQARFAASQAEQRLAELDKYGEAGLWQVRVLAGAATPEELALIAPLLAGSAELGAHPYRLASPAGPRPPAGLASALTAELPAADGGPAVPFAATAGVLTALTGLPRHEVPGVRLIRPGSFDLTADQRAAGPGVPLGSVLDRRDRPVGTFSVGLATLNRHALVAGATGAGKSQTVRHLLEQLSRAGLPWLAVEPVKSEYGVMATRLAGIAPVTVLNPADPDSVPLSVNPLEPEPGYPVQAHLDMVRALFLAAFDAQEPFPQILAQALARVYEECGWDLVTGAGQPGAAAPPAVPTLAQLQAAALGVITDVGYGRELQADMRGFIDVRLRSLRTGSAGRFFEGGHPASIEALLAGNVVLALEDVANDEDKAFVMGTLIIRIVEHLRLRSRSAPARGLSHVIVLEEAHRLLRAGREGASAHAVELFAGQLAEIRAYGEGIVVAEQIPAKLVPDVVKNTALKVLHRLPAADDRELVGAAMNLDEGQSARVVSLAPGEAVAFADGMDRPMRIRVPFGGGREQRPPGEDGGTPGGTGLLAGRRSAACGPVCTAGLPCTVAQIRAADLAAGADAGAWLRVFAEVHVLAHVCGRSVPAVPPALASWRHSSPDRLAGCALAIAVDGAVARRARALRASYDPAGLARACAVSAASLLDGTAAAGSVPDPRWVTGQLRWLHERDRLSPPAAADGPAPPLDYPLPGLAEGAGDTAAGRARALRASPLSMALAGNRQAAWTALLGDDDQHGFIADLELITIGAAPGELLATAASKLAVTGWLAAVLSWPRRLIAGAADEPASPARQVAPAAR